MDSKLSVLLPEDPNPNEKRRYLRVPLRVLRVETKIGGEIFFGHATNISRTGLFIQTVNPKPVGMKVYIKFLLPENKEMITCLAEITWIQDFIGPKGPQPGMGLKFLELNPTTETMIAAFIEQSNE